MISGKKIKNTIFLDPSPCTSPLVRIVKDSDRPRNCNREWPNTHFYYYL